MSNQNCSGSGGVVGLDNQDIVVAVCLDPNLSLLVLAFAPRVDWGLGESLVQCY